MLPKIRGNFKGGYRGDMGGYMGICICIVYIYICIKGYRGFSFEGFPKLGVPVVIRTCGKLPKFLGKALQYTTRKGTTYLEGQGDLASRLISPITHIVTLLIPIINLLTKSP